MTQRSRRRRFIGGAVVTAALFALAAGCQNDNGQNSLQPNGEDAQKIMNLFTPIFWIGVVVGVGVFTALIIVLIRYRERTGDESPKQVHGSTSLEIGWTIAPAVILAAIAVPTILLIFDLDERPTGDEVLKVNVTGKQWWWQYEYPEQAQVAGQPVVTANELHIPVDTQVELALSSCDAGFSEGECNVIHSFWVPELAGKEDVIPGRENYLNVSADRTGTFLGQCAEYCGLSHANMRLRVVVHEKDEFEAWVADQQTSGPELSTTQVNDAGEEETVTVGGPTDAPTLFTTTFGCTNCHSFTDSSTASFGPNLAHLATRGWFAGATYELTRENLIDWVMNAPGMKPMESQAGCPDPEKKCVGMPSFTNDLPSGQAPMTEQQAAIIADFLLEETQ